ncbi:hypothetical protein [Methylobacterium dankookense]|uniref:Uncharacterized protein n=1 Tax=Methylobacterium dankookense TaxID=560405 RepID=A0A564G572_9HYPH|nr:hypothetical protein [Methylobacterium dankookense]GJD55199.1 hypothetical protein IFDJLNFL_1082 [Methylobacterium dankookense]VUF15222.1 hypothetical protein MTDSW087_04958 [Methylobacterium dankookense]
MPDANDPLHDLCRAFIEKHRISCPEATAEDRVYEHAPELVYEIAKIVGFYRYPDEEGDE